MKLYICIYKNLCSSDLGGRELLELIIYGWDEFFSINMSFFNCIVIGFVVILKIVVFIIV